MSLVLTVGLLQVVLPIALLVWLWRGKEASRATGLAKALMTALYCAGIAVAGLWSFLPWTVPYLYLLLAISAVIRSFRVSPPLPALPPKAMVPQAELAAYAIAAIALAAVLIQALLGYVPPGPTVSLSFPMRGGTFVVANGGNSILINAHLGLKGEKFRVYRGQNLAVDLLQLNSLGTRALGVQPTDLTRYAIFGTPVHAPCAGAVLRTENDAPDMTPPERDRGNIPGNFVFMECSGVHILLAHFQKGSVQVAPGHIVAEGALLGRVGNSGNTDEPHLHVHAQAPGSEGAFLDGDPLPITFDGDYLVRNERVVRD